MPHSTRIPHHPRPLGPCYPPWTSPHRQPQDARHRFPLGSSPRASLRSVKQTGSDVLGGLVGTRLLAPARQPRVPGAPQQTRGPRHRERVVFSADGNICLLRIRVSALTYADELLWRTLLASSPGVIASIRGICHVRPAAVSLEARRYAFLSRKSPPRRLCKPAPSSCQNVPREPQPPNPSTASLDRGDGDLDPARLPIARRPRPDEPSQAYLAIWPADADRTR